jgi:hypothetical protein
MRYKMRLLILFCAALMIVPIPVLTGPIFAENQCGNLTGFVYGEDGKTPLQDATVCLRCVETNKVYQSTPTARTGDYRVLGVEAGTYVVGLKVNEKTYNVENAVNVCSGRTDIISFSIQTTTDTCQTLAGGPGWCCLKGNVFNISREECIQCGGDFFLTKREAQERCGGPLVGFFNTSTGVAILIIGTGVVSVVDRLVRDNVGEISTPEQSQ